LSLRFILASGLYRKSITGKTLQDGAEALMKNMALQLQPQEAGQDDAGN